MKTLPASLVSLAAVHGRIHSTESCGTVDGPGIRFIVFAQGCPLRCLYCHNPDCRDPDQGQDITVGELLQQISSYQSYLRRGGVTVSGGEPLMQPAFVAALMQGCHELGLHTALDTSGYTTLAAAKPLCRYHCWPRFCQCLFGDLSLLGSQIGIHVSCSPWFGQCPDDQPCDPLQRHRCSL
jgi:pyruvate-formate lyase-activating enzyme